jgi:site-specific recombinase XerD
MRPFRFGVNVLRAGSRAEWMDDDVNFHTLRHTFASWAVQGGATLQEIKDLLGHHSMAMVLRYSHLSSEHLRSAVARLDAVLPATLPTSSSTQDSTQEIRSAVGVLSK